MESKITFVFLLARESHNAVYKYSICSNKKIIKNKNYGSKSKHWCNKNIKQIKMYIKCRIILQFIISENKT